MTKEEKTKFTFSDDDAGHAFAKALTKIIERKQGRNSLYKDNWYDRNRITYHTDRIDSKAGRIKQAEDNFFAGKINLDYLMDILEEEAGDIAVYSIFVMAKIAKLREMVKGDVAASSSTPTSELYWSVPVYLTERDREDDDEET